MDASRSNSISAKTWAQRRLKAKSQLPPTTIQAKKMYGKSFTGNGGTG